MFRLRNSKGVAGSTRGHHTFRTRIDDALSPLELPVPQFAVLTAVDTGNGISNAELARVACPQEQGIPTNLEPARFSGWRAKRVQEIERLLADAVGPENTARFAGILSRCRRIDGPTRVGNPGPRAATYCLMSAFPRPLLPFSRDRQGACMVGVADGRSG